MTLDLQLTPAEELHLAASAQRLGVEPAEYLRRLLDQDITASPDGSQGMTIGSELLAGWEADGVLGLFADAPDSPQFARELREAGERRW